MNRTATPIQLLDFAIENDVIAGELGVSIDDLAKRLIRDKAEIIAALTPNWQFERVVKLFRAKRLELARKRRAEGQYLLPGFEGLPQRIVIRDGKRRPLEKATYRQLRDYFEVLRKRANNNPRLAKVKALMELVHPYAQDTPGITVREVCEREQPK